jgi:hypothetical protein
MAARRSRDDPARNREKAVNLKSDSGDDEHLFVAIATYLDHRATLSTKRSEQAVERWCARDDELFRELITTVPSTLHGLLALVAALRNTAPDLHARVSGEPESLSTLLETIERCLRGLKPTSSPLGLRFGEAEQPSKNQRKNNDLMGIVEATEEMENRSHR